MIKPEINMIGITQSSNRAPPVSQKSTKFIASSIETIESKDIPNAALNANSRLIWRDSIMVSRIIEVINPFLKAIGAL